MSGPFVDELNDSHFAAIDSLRESLGAQLTRHPSVNTDWFLLRFLRARNFNLKNTQKMMKEYLDFRDRKDFTRLANFDEFQLQKVGNYFYHFHFAVDRMGRPVIMEDFGKSRLVEAGQELSMEEVEDWFAQVFDRTMHIEFPVCSAVAGRRIEKMMFIFDIGKINIVKLFNGKFRSIIELIIRVGQDFCPEVLEILFVINAPFMVKGVWAIVATMLDPNTRKKIFFESDNGSKKLKELIDPSQLPVNLGGANPLPLHLCEPPYKPYIQDSIKRKSLTLPTNEYFNRFFLSSREKLALERSGMPFGSHISSIPMLSRQNTQPQSLGYQNIPTSASPQLLDPQGFHSQHTRSNSQITISQPTPAYPLPLHPHSKPTLSNERIEHPNVLGSKSLSPMNSKVYPAQHNQSSFSDVPSGNQSSLGESPSTPPSTLTDSGMYIYPVIDGVQPQVFYPTVIYQQQGLPYNHPLCSNSTSNYTNTDQSGTADSSKNQGKPSNLQDSLIKCQYYYLCDKERNDQTDYSSKSGCKISMSKLKSIFRES